MDMKERVFNAGNFNAWKGCIGLYFTKKEVRAMKHGITEDTPIRDAYNLLAN